MRVVGVSFANATWEPDGVLQPRILGHGFFLDEMWDDNAAVRTVAIGGPYNPRGPGDTASRRKIFVCRPARSADEEPCARKILSTIARRAYRRPVGEADLKILLKFYEEGRTLKGFDSGIARGIESSSRHACRFSCGAAFPTTS
jgi:hypothetical protein